MVVGRAAELEVLAASIDADEAVVVTGEAGVGKTALGLAAVRGSGRRLVRGGALASLRHVPLLAIERALGRSLGMGDELAAARALERAVGDGVLLLDDVHLAHTTTVEAVAILAGRLPVIATARFDEGAGATIGRLLDAGYRELHVSGLDEGAAAEYVRSRRPDLSDARVDEIVARAGGNPLFLEELTIAEVLPPDLALAVRHRLERLPDAAQEAAAVLALAAVPLDPDAFAPDVVSALRHAGLLASGSRIALRHGLLGELVSAGLDGERRRSLHRRVAGATSDPAVRAVHLEAAGEADAAAAEAVSAHDAAATVGERAHWAATALALTPPRSLDVERALVVAREVASRDAVTARRLLERIPPTTSELDAARDAAVAILDLHETLDIAATKTALLRALRSLEGSNSRWEAMVIADLAALELAMDFEGGLAAAERAVEVAAAIGHEQPRARITLANALLVAGRPGWDELLQATIDDGLEQGDLFVAAIATRQRSIGLRLSGRPADAATAAMAMAERLDAAGLALLAVDLQSEALAALAAAGRFSEAARIAEELLEGPMPGALRSRLYNVAGRALAVMGRRTAAIPMLEALQRSTTGTPFEAPDADEVAAGWWVLGRPRRAAEVLAAANREEVASGTGPSPLVAGWVAWDLGEPRRDLTARPGIAAVGGAEPAEVAALVALAEGDPSAAEKFDAAGDAWAPLQVEDELRCRWAAGEAARLTGHAGAVERLLVALRQARAHGAGAFGERCERSLRATGVRPPAEEGDPRGQALAALTAREREAIGRVAEGAATAEIASAMGISRRTVESFIASACRKLGASTRTEAAAQLTGVRR